MKLKPTSILLFAVFVVYCYITFTTAQATTTTNTTVVPQVRFIRDYVPISCPRPAQPNDLITFHYSAHLVTKDNRVGETFDETADYAPLTLEANSRQMLPPLARALEGVCMDERRTVVIPYIYAQFESLPKNTDIVFIVHVLEVTPHNDMFQIIDIDRSGCITEDEFIAYIESTGRVAENLVETTARRLMRHNDRNKDGVVECEELIGSPTKYCDIVVNTCHKKPDDFESWLIDNGL